MSGRPLSALLALALACASPPEAPPSPVRVAAERSLESAQAALEGRQWSAAARNFGRAADALAALDAGLPEAAARRGQAEALLRAGDAAGAEVAGHRALSLDRALGAPEGAARDLTGLARAAAARGDPAVALARAEEALSLAPASSHLATLVRNDLAVYLIERGDAVDRARAESLLGLALAESMARGDAEGVAAAELNLARAALAGDDPGGAAARAERALGSYRALENPEGIAHAHELLAAVARARGDRPLSAFHLDQAKAGFTFLDDRAALSRLERTAP